MKRFVIFMLAIMLITLVPVSTSAADEIVLPDLISDHMLIQQAKPIKLWGSGPKGETVTIKLMSGSRVLSKGTAVTPSTGIFRAELPPVMAGGPYALEFSTSTTSKTIEDVMVGELWIQCGQSNMARKISGTGSFASSLLPSGKNDKIRLFINTTSESSTSRETDLSGYWMVSDRSTANGYSAVGFTALNKLQSELDMPVGGICNAIDGAGMSSYTGPNSKGGTGGSYYNKKVAPVTQFNVRGVMWYQGESDRGQTADNFASMFKNLINSWRRDWDDPDMPFLFVALPPSPMKYYASWHGAYIMEDFSDARLGQLKVYNELENTGVAVSMDCPPNPGEDSLHPCNKKPIGERLALSAMGLVYGTADKWSSPLYKSVSVSGNTATITFSHAYDGLKTTDNKAPRCFMAAGSDGKFHTATAEITGKNTVKITCSAVSDIKQISYAVEKDMWPYTSPDDAVINTYADVNLVNSEGHPLCPFRHSITDVVNEKKVKFTSPVIETVAAKGEGYAFPKTVELSKGDVKETQNVIWSLGSVNTKTEKTYSFYGFAENADIIIPAKVTVKNVSDNPVPSVSAEYAEGKVNITASSGESQANRAMYILVGFYKADGLYISAKSIPLALYSGASGDIIFSEDVPEGAEKAKIMVIGQSMKLYSYEYVEIK